jgi:hypothetical protein
MATVKWLLEPEVFQYEDQSILDALESKGVEHKVCQFGKTYEEVVRCFPADDCVIVHGSLQLGRAVDRNTKWVPGVWCNLRQFECLYYYPRFGTHLLNAAHAMLPFGSLRYQKEWIADKFSDQGCIFLRPSSGFKTFTGHVVELVHWEEELRDLSFRLDPEVLVVVSPPIEIIREWRLVVSNRVVAHSQYKEGKGLVRIQGSDLHKVRETPQEVLDYGERVLKEVKYRPDPVWTLDICETRRGLNVLETGSFSCAGLYACDPNPIIDEVNQLALTEWEDCH